MKLLLLLALSISLVAGCSRPTSAPVSPGPLPAVPLANAAVAAPPLPRVPERIGFKGDTPGVMTFEQFAAKYAFTPVEEGGERREPAAAEQGGIAVGEGWYAIEVPNETTIALVPVREARYQFTKGRLERIRLQTDPDRDAFLYDALASRAKQSTDALPSKEGSFEWESTGTVVRLVSSPKGCEVTFADREMAADHDRMTRIREANARAAKENERYEIRKKALEDL